MARSVLILGFLLLSTGAHACPDITGVYLAANGDDSLVRFDQQGCEELSRAVGLYRDGQTDFVFDRTFRLNNEKSCIGAVCESFEASDAAVSWRMENYAANWIFPEHGRCFFRKADFTKDEAGRLVASAEVYKCRDDYRGPAKRVFEAFRR